MSQKTVVSRTTFTILSMVAHHMSCSGCMGSKYLHHSTAGLPDPHIFSQVKLKPFMLSSRMSSATCLLVHVASMKHESPVTYIWFVQSFWMTVLADNPANEFHLLHTNLIPDRLRALSMLTVFWSAQPCLFYCPFFIGNANLCIS